MAKYPWVMGKFPWVMEIILGFFENLLQKRDFWKTLSNFFPKIRIMEKNILSELISKFRRDKKSGFKVKSQSQAQGVWRLGGHRQGLLKASGTTRQSSRPPKGVDFGRFRPFLNLLQIRYQKRLSIMFSASQPASQGQSASQGSQWSPWSPWPWGRWCLWRQPGQVGRLAFAATVILYEIIKPLVKIHVSWKAKALITRIKSPKAI